MIDSIYAPGGPGIPARRTSSAKSGVGTSLSPASRVRFTIRCGILMLSARRPGVYARPGPHHHGDREVNSAGIGGMLFLIMLHSPDGHKIRC
jgi:Glucodextranase, domain N